MSFVIHLLGEALREIATFDGALWATVARTLWLAVASTAAAGVLAVPLGSWLGLRAAERRSGRCVLTVANIGFGLPPVVLGILLGLVLLPGAPLGSLGWLATLRGVWLAQVVLAVPLIVALTATAAQQPAPLIAQARALGAPAGARLILLAAELRPAIAGALLAAMLAGVGEVGAVIIVGGNVAGHTTTLASTIVLDLGAGDPVGATAHALLLAMLVAALTLAVRRVQRPLLGRATRPFPGRVR
ncbi:MAG: ABC transporter permease [Patulibacter sp.]